MDLDVLVDAWRGTLQMSLLSAFKSSHDEHIAITRSPLQGVHVNRVFKVHGLQLAALIGNVAVTCDRPSHASSIPIGTVFSKDGVGYIGHLKPMLKFPPKVVRTGCAHKGVEPLLVGYWAARSAYASADVNAEQIHKDIHVKVGVLSTTTADGTRICEFSMRVISTPRRKSNITVELTLALLSWAIVAMGQLEGNAFKRLRRERDLIALTQPNCQWRNRGRPVIFCRYRTADGEWKMHMETPWKSVDESMQTWIIREVEARAQRFYEENHVPVVDESPSPRS